MAMALLERLGSAAAWFIQETLACAGAAFAGN
jgi:hypothetical protein